MSASPLVLMVGSLVLLRPAWGGTAVTAACNLALSRGTGETEALYPQLTSMSDEDFVRAVVAMFRPKFKRDWSRYLQDAAIRPYVPRLRILPKAPRYFRTFRPDDSLGRMLLKTDPPRPSRSPTSPLVDVHQGQRSFAIHRRGKYRRRGVVQVWTEAPLNLGSGMMVRTRVFIQQGGGRVKMLSDDTEWTPTDVFFFVPVM